MFLRERSNDACDILYTEPIATVLVSDLWHLHSSVRGDLVMR